MATMNPNIILQAGQTADILGAMQQGNALAQATNQQRNDNALSGFLRDNSGALLSGDQNALAQYAQYDPQAAINMQRQMQIDAQRADEMQYQRGRDTAQDARADREFEMQQSRYAKQDDRADQEWQWKVAEYAASKSDQERAAEAAQIESAVKMGLAAQSPEQWDALVTQAGAPDLVGQFDSREAIGNQYLSIAEILKGSRVSPLSGPGKVQADINAGYLPKGTPLRGEAPVTNINMGENSSAFIKKSDELAASRIGDIAAEGQSAGRLMGDLQALSDLAGQINTGKGAELLNRFGPYAEMVGVSIEGLPEMQAYQAIVDRLAPQMRAPGAGATSDFDARQFLSSLPNLARTPEGNAIINETLQSVQRQKIAASEIAGQALRGEIAWQEAERKIAALSNPYETFNKMRGKISGGGAAQAPQVGDIRKGYRFRGGDPTDQANWERQ